MVRIYTRSGDKGTTSLIYGKRVPKNDLRVEAYGTCDETNSMIGLALSFLENETWDGKKEFLEIMHRVQTILFHAGAELATPSEKEVTWKLKKEYIKELEEQIDTWDKELAKLRNFILPSGHSASSALHAARTVARRAERTAVGLEEELANPLVLSYLNRLSDFLFVAARYVNQCLGGKEIPLKADV
ncbi:cob(I)yrinic acid a,c-diamide adenosyltransferase [Virgibacillus dakarensis]|uniref:Corrinoid adenosyltransferase n=1 Tax=Lentibacillus populi TaxID=1827502 RepID=A0A9W5U1J4_9BACI|nr:MULTISPECIES: cob(I)yrinic acid a,c-diamide adenosyltransferase [Bacillaceae]MBT2217743.1 cob(I)yrinic acid a,c-diamide adenosyltransferase [Virgibacillus dakarensis]MTW88098.1 cob(I)yrinic acid a,c-diamide adenosyltransferase [Virgibacillus dakarensis]GGB57831.1 ATP--cob(I)alamin adenosyltransferase [Lentibacillus populi]